MDSVTELAAKRLKNAITSKGLTQAELAEKAGLTLATINAFCNGHKRIINETFQQIIDALGMPLGHFIGSERGEHPAFPGQEMTPVEAKILKIVDEAISSLTAASKPHVNLPDDATEADIAYIAEMVALVSPLSTENKQAALAIVQAMRNEFDVQNAALERKRKEKATQRA